MPILILTARKGRMKLNVRFPAHDAFLVGRRAELLALLGWADVQIINRTA
jgi:hypothetical protein